MTYWDFPQNLQAAILLAIFAGAIVLIRILWQPQTKYRYPPGPKGLPILGNLLQLPPKYPGAQLIRWAEQYGDLCSIQIGSRRWVFINSMEVVRELLDRRGRLYISRPEFPITQDIASQGNRIVLMPYSERWRNLRKVMHSLLMAGNADNYKPFQDLESKTLIWQCWKNPELFYQHTARFANSVIFSVVFGQRTSMRDRNVQELFHTIEDFLGTQSTPSTTVPEQFPNFIRMLPMPLQWFRPKAERIYKKTFGLYTAFLDDLEKRVQAGEDPQCFARGMNDLAAKYDFDDAQKAFCVGTLIEAGSDTTRNQINVMLAAAAKYPVWVKTAQNYLDEVCGDAERLPAFEDWDQLPYIIAVIKESMRWRPNLTPTGVPRTLIQDDAYRDFVFEKGTIFTFNSFAISHNEKEHFQNEIFMPERHLKEDLQELLKGHLGFGTGRRVCPGWHVATRNMFIAFARLLFCFDFHELESAPINEWEMNAMAHDDAPFLIKIIPRSDAHMRLMAQSCAQFSIDI